MKKLFTSAVLLSTAMAAFAGGHEEGGKPGRMTGGGAIICPAPAYRVTFGYELHCKTSEGGLSGPNNLEVNFSTGDHFHLSSLDTATCSGPDATTPDAPFNTFTGTGSGTLNGETAMISFVLVDKAEPGRGADTASFTITTTEGTALRCGPQELDGGNNQAHRVTGNKP